MQRSSRQARPGNAVTVARLAGVAAIVAGTTLAGCGGSELPPSAAPRVCTLKGYYQGANIDLVAPVVEGAAVTWRVEVTSRGETVVVESTGDGLNAAPQCGAGAENRDLGCARRGELIEVAVTSWPGSPTRVRVANVGALGGPAELTLRVIHGAATTTRTLRPRYESTEPNGPGCGVALNSINIVELESSAP